MDNGHMKAPDTSTGMKGRSNCDYGDSVSDTGGKAILFGVSTSLDVLQEAHGSPESRTGMFLAVQIP